MNDPQDRYCVVREIPRFAGFDWCTGDAHLVFWGLPFGSTLLGDAHG
jgi:hypothetical protein